MIIHSNKYDKQNNSIFLTGFVKIWKTLGSVVLGNTINQKLYTRAYLDQKMKSRPYVSQKLQVRV